MELSIIIVEYQDLEDLKICLKSLRKYTAALDREIIVSSNSEYGITQQRELREEMPDIRWIFNEKNLGFAKGVNAGIRICRGKYIFLINPDASLLDSRMGSLIEYMKQNPDVGIAGPKLVDSHGKVQDSTRSFISFQMFIGRILKRFIKRIDGEILEEKNYEITRPSNWISGACMIVRRSAIDKVGLMDERYFMYIEDMDWCLRFWRAGFKVVYWPHMRVFHDPTRTSSSVLAARRMDRLMFIHLFNYMKFFLKFFPRSLSEKKLQAWGAAGHR